MLYHQFPDPGIITRLKNRVSAPQAGNFIEWPDALVRANCRSFWKHTPESSFTIITNLQGACRLSFDKRTLKVCEESFFVFNPFQEFEYLIESEQEVQTQNIHFSFRSYSQALHSLLQNDAQLLDDPEGKALPDYHFHNHLHYKDAKLRKLLGSHEYCSSDEYLLALLQQVLLVDRRNKGRIEQIQTKKKTTQQELFRRMAIARDIIFSSYHSPELSVEQLSREVALSKFHFLRLFKQVWGYTPYQFIRLVRIEKARIQLQNSQIPIHEVALQVGFQEANSLYAIMQQHFAQTPGKLRNN